MVNIIFFIILVAINLLILLSHKKIINIISIKFDIYDYPNSNLKIHEKPTPLFGGIWIYINLILFFIYYLIFSDNSELYELFDEYSNLIVFFFSFTAIFCIGLYDDVYDLDPNKKLFSFFFVVVCFLLLVPDLLIQSLTLTYKDLNLTLGLRNFSFLFTAICIVAYINAINMLDGVDGQTALYSFFFLALFQIFVVHELNYFLLTIMTILLFFFILNIQGQIFIGNSGSYLIGFIFSFLLLSEYKDGEISLNLIFMLVIVPALEMLRVCFSRVINGKNPFKGDKDHLHHLLLKKFSKTKSILIFQLVSLMPFILYIIGMSKIYTLFLTLIAYILMITFFKKSKLYSNL